MNPGLRLLGVVLCMYEASTRLAGEIGRDVESFLGGTGGSAGGSGAAHQAWRDARLFQTRIRRNIRLAEAPSFGQSIFDYAPDSHGAEDYAALSGEVDRAVATGLIRRVA